MIKVGIIGANGYGGGELLRILAQHPGVEVAMIASRSQEGKRLAEVFPTFWGHPLGEKTFVDSEEPKNASGCDVVFLSVPHGVSAKMSAALLEQGVRIIDLGADFRIKSTDVYEQWYKVTHAAPGLLTEAVYGLPELFRAAIPKARIVGNPGCYPTATLLGLAPLLQKGLVDLEHIIIDAKSGASGAGRTPKAELVFGEISDSLRAYGIGTHRHTPEIESVIDILAGTTGTRISFTPHILPMARGILSTIHLSLKEKLTSQELTAILREFYAGSPFVTVLPEPFLPETKAVLGSNRCQIGARVDARTDQTIIVSVIDNLGKGMAGQAVQNMNLMFGLDETVGLTATGIWP